MGIYLLRTVTLWYSLLGDININKRKAVGDRVSHWVVNDGIHYFHCIEHLETKIKIYYLLSMEPWAAPKKALS